MVNRRDVLLAFLGSLSLAFLRPASSMAAGPEDRAWMNTLAGGLDPTGVRQLASEYLRQNPDERDPEQLLDLILERLDGNEPIGVYLRDAVRSDFANDAAVNLLGWRLARTEGRILAAIAGCCIGG